MKKAMGTILKIFGALAIGFIGLIIMVAVFFTEDEAKKTDKTTPAKAEQATQKETAKKEEPPKLKGLKQPLKVGDVTFTASNVTVQKEVKSDYAKSVADGTFLSVIVSVKNGGKEMLNIDSSFFQLKKGDVTYSPTTILMDVGDQFMYDGLNPGISKTGRVYFDVPTDVAASTDLILNVQTGVFGTEQGEIKIK